MLFMMQFPEEMADTKPVRDQLYWGYQMKNMAAMLVAVTKPIN
jgi:hypothetical protein